MRYTTAAPWIGRPDVVTPFMCFLVALVGALSATELVRVVAVRLHAVDQPGGRRLHRRPTPRLGGMGIAWGFGASLAFLGWVAGPIGGSDRELPTLLAGAAFLGAVGHLDDRNGLPSLIKLVACIAAAITIWAGGWRVESLGLPGLGTWEVGIWSLPLTLAWVVLVTNAVNLIDGLDGLASGLGLLACVAVVVMPGSGALERSIAVALAGALLGFLWFNLHPAVIFMGDAGSLFVGFILAALMLHVPVGATQDGFPLLPSLLLAVPIADTLYAIARRTWAAARAAQSPLEFVCSAPSRMFAADRGHVHHLLQAAGDSPWRAVAQLWGAAACFAVVGCVWARDAGAGLVLFGTSLLAWSWVGWRVSRRLPRSTATPTSQMPAALTAGEEPAPPIARAA
jgi:UDP-GlcNAc:undecaprenyl-phosphate GlcNAc-1-phosphate transferase